MTWDDNWKAVALVRFPSCEIKSFSTNADALQLNDLATEKEGFIYAPFRTEEGVYLLKPEKDTNRVLNFLTYCENNLHTAENQATTLQQYRNSATTMLQQLRKNELKKVILSRIIEAPHSVNAQAKKLFDLLCAEYPKACVHLFAHRELGIWLGATPEVLLQWENNKLSTAAVAGTARYNNENFENIIWGDKEVEEHELVSEFIANILWREEGIDWLEENCIETIRAGAVLHLISKFSAKTNNAFQWPDLIKKLHPTPAVCGLPLNAALQAIEQYEPHKRLFYTGFFGTISPDAVKLFVNLRCLKWFKDCVHIYVGGGLTALSEVESEWDETTYKSLTLLNVLEKI